jgi:hypothetical protein
VRATHKIFCGRFHRFGILKPPYNNMNSILRSALLFLFGLIVYSHAYSQTTNGLKKELVGTWEFLGMHDKSGNKVDTIRNQSSPTGYVLASGPLTTYRADGTYSRRFTPQNTDNGKWRYDEDKHLIIHQLYYAKPYSVAAKYLIDIGHAKKDENGDYYEFITTMVVELTDSKLIVLEREGGRSTYVKRKE